MIHMENVPIVLDSTSCLLRPVGAPFTYKGGEFEDGFLLKTCRNDWQMDFC